MFMRSRVPLSLEESENTQIIPAAGQTRDACLLHKVRDVVCVVPLSVPFPRWQFRFSYLCSCSSCPGTFLGLCPSLTVTPTYAEIPCLFLKSIFSVVAKR